MARLSLPSAARSLSSAVLVGLVLVPLALADGDHLHGAKAESQAHNDDSQNDAEYPPTYFALADHANLIYAHIALMTIAWVFILPIGKSQVSASKVGGEPAEPFQAMNERFE
jgi:hypothetical protein